MSNEVCISLHYWITWLFNPPLWGKKSIRNVQEGLTGSKTGKNELLCLVICCTQKWARGERVWWQSCWQFKPWLRHKINTLFLMVKLDGAVMGTFCLPCVFLAPSLSSDPCMAFISARRRVKTLFERVRSWVHFNCNPGCMRLHRTPLPDPMKTHKFQRVLYQALVRWHWLDQSWFGHSTFCAAAFMLLWRAKGSPDRPGGWWQRLYTPLETRSLKLTRGNMQLVEEKCKSNPRNMAAITSKEWVCWDCSLPACVTDIFTLLCFFILFFF